MTDVYMILFFTIGAGSCIPLGGMIASPPLGAVIGFSTTIFCQMLLD